VQAASSVAAVVTQTIERIRIFIDVPFFKPSAIVAYGLGDRHRAGHVDGTGKRRRGGAPERPEPPGAHIARGKETH
jgi:hypothetical protein